MNCHAAPREQLFQVPKQNVAEAVRRAEQNLVEGAFAFGECNARELGRVWSAWYVGSERDASSPDRVAHSALVYGITASGRLLTIYPANFRPADLAHDVPLLAGR